MNDKTERVTIACNEKSSPTIEQGFVNVGNSGAKVIPHKQTNGEWLRGLSDEELAKWWFEVDECSERFLAWLRAEHKEVDE